MQNATATTAGRRIAAATTGDGGCTPPHVHISILFQASDSDWAPCARGARGARLLAGGAPRRFEHRPVHRSRGAAAREAHHGELLRKRKMPEEIEGRLRWAARLRAKSSVRGLCARSAEELQSQAAALRGAALRCAALRARTALKAVTTPRAPFTRPVAALTVFTCGCGRVGAGG